MKSVCGFILTLLCALSLQSCSEESTSPSEFQDGFGASRLGNPIPVDEIQGVEWRLIGFEEVGQDGVLRTRPIPEDQTYTLTMKPDGKAEGIADCKGYDYSYTITPDGRISFFDRGPQITLHCGDYSYDLRFYRGMESAYAYEASPDALRIHFHEASPIKRALLFTRGSASPSPTPIEFQDGGTPPPGPSDPYTILESSIVGDQLHLTVQYGGGCAPHEFRLIGPIGFEPGDPTPYKTILHHNANGDMCKALIKTTLIFDLVPLKERWSGATGRTDGVIHLFIDDLQTGMAAELDYTIAGATGTENPQWLNDTIAMIMSRPPTNPTEAIYRNSYQGRMVYFRPAVCCDMFSSLYDEIGNTICHPDGGITGTGDGRCPDYVNYRGTEVLVWKDPR